MAITIEPLGGLGNQLFVYATGLARALDLGTDLCADLRNFRDYAWHTYELDSFRNGMTHVELSKAGEWSRSYRELHRRALRKVNLKPALGTRGELSEESSRFDERVNEVPDGTRLRGYFQSPRYFMRHADVVRARVRDIVDPSDWYLQTHENLSKMPAWAAVHVRRGNYVGLPNMGIAHNDYYRRALELLWSIEPHIPLVVFSDDIETARTLPVLESARDVTFLEPPTATSPLESVLLMSLAHHIVIANSSFSWWAAWLRDRPERIVVCPRPWLDDLSFDDRDLLPADWVTLGRT